MPRESRQRLVVRFVADRAAEADQLAAALAAELPSGRVVRVSRRGRALLSAEGDMAVVAREVAARPEVEWAEPDEVDHAVDDDGAEPDGVDRAVDDDGAEPDDRAEPDA